MHGLKILNLGKWVVGAAAAATMTCVVSEVFAAQCAARNPIASSYSIDSFKKWDSNWDKRDPLSLLKASTSKNDMKQSELESEKILREKYEKLKPKVKRHLILVRHGQYNQDGVQENERFLTKLGEQQAEITGRRLKCSGIHFDKIVSSDMTRAIQTATIILKEVNQPGLCLAIKDPILREGSPCYPEPSRHNALSYRHEPYEYFQDEARIEAAFRKYFHRADPKNESDVFEIIVCHANVIRYFVCRALQFPGEAWRRISLNHCSISIISIAPCGRVLLRMLGDAGHIPSENKSTGRELPTKPSIKLL